MGTGTAELTSAGLVRTPVCGLGFFGVIGVFLPLILRLGGGVDCGCGSPASALGTATADITSAGLVRTPFLNRGLGCGLVFFLTPLILLAGATVGSGTVLFRKNLL